MADGAVTEFDGVEGRSRFRRYRDGQGNEVIARCASAAESADVQPRRGARDRLQNAGFSHAAKSRRLSKVALACAATFRDHNSICALVDMNLYSRRQRLLDDGFSTERRRQAYVLVSRSRIRPVHQLAAALHRRSLRFLRQRPVAIFALLAEPDWTSQSELR